MFPMWMRMIWTIVTGKHEEIFYWETTLWNDSSILTKMYFNSSYPTSVINHKNPYERIISNISHFPFHIRYESRHFQTMTLVRIDWIFLKVQPWKVWGRLHPPVFRVSSVPFFSILLCGADRLALLSLRPSPTHSPSPLFPRFSAGTHQPKLTRSCDLLVMFSRFLVSASQRRKKKEHKRWTRFMCPRTACGVDAFIICNIASAINLTYVRLCVAGRRFLYYVFRHIVQARPAHKPLWPRLPKRNSTWLTFFGTLPFYFIYFIHGFNWRIPDKNLLHVYRNVWTRFAVLHPSCKEFC